MGAPIIGISHVDLSVRDRAASARWYAEVLGFEVHHETRNDAFGFSSIVMVHSGGRASIALLEHDEHSTEPFDVRRCGLDHLSFELPAGTDLEAWGPVAHDDDGVPLVVLRDPDDIPIELYAGRLGELG